MDRPARRAAIVASALLLAAPGTATALPGQLDPSFGRDGTFTLTRPAARPAPSTAIAPMRDGGVIMASESALIRLTPRGRRERFTRVSRGSVHSITPLRNGRVLAAVQARESVALLRLRADGRPDRRFGAAGRVGLGRGIRYVIAAGVDRRGRILVVGTREFESGPTYMMRLSPSGRRDRAFGRKGRLVPDLPGSGSVITIALSDGSIAFADVRMAGSVTNFETVIRRITPRGRLDRRFGADGTAVIRIGGATAGHPFQFSAGPGGTLLVAQKTSAGTGVMLLRRDGSADAGFGSGGAALLPAPLDERLPLALAADRRGRVLVGGRVGDTAYVARLGRNGQLDPSFGLGGIVHRHFGRPPRGGLAFSTVTHLAIRRDGRILAAGIVADRASGIREDFGTVYATVTRLLG